MSSALERRANNALGICLICVVFALETVVAHHHQPNPASPFVWAALGSTAVACLFYYLKHRPRSRAR